MIKLPDDPKNKDYEDWVIAVLSSYGYFVEPNVQLRLDGEDILEVDVIATPCDDPDQRILIDAKSGGWHFSDIFKMYGWRSYLGIEKAYIIYSKDTNPKKFDAAKQIAREAGVLLCQMSLAPVVCDEIPKALTTDDDLLSMHCAVACWFNAAVRLLRNEFIQYCKSHASDYSVKCRDYDWEVQNSVFIQTPLRRARQLYDAWQRADGLVGEAVREIAEKDGENEIAVYRNLENTTSHPWLQYMLYLHHSARLRIIKNALDCLWGTSGDNNELDFMPPAFVETLHGIKDKDCGPRIPFALQVYLQTFGGFLSFASTTDTELFSKLTDLTKSECDFVIGLYDRFFPIADGQKWHIEQPSTSLRRLKQCCGLILGAGCFFRAKAHGISSYEEHYAQSHFLLSKWHDVLYKFLEPEYKI